MTTSTPGGTHTLCGRPVPRIGYGMGGLTRSAGSPEGRRAAVDLLRHAFDLGVRMFDTAHFYGDGLANELLAEAFGDRRDEVLYATKAGARAVPGMPPLTAAQKPDELRASVEVNLRTLGTDRLDLVYLRRMDFLPGLLAEGDQQVPFDDQLAALVELRDAGTIGGIGLSHVTKEQVERALPAGVVAVQNIYSMLTRDDEPLLDLCREHAIAWIPYFPLGSGGAYAGLPKVVDDPVVQDVARELGATPSQVGLAWQLAHNPTTMLIPGTSSTAHLDENVAAGSVRLDERTMARLDAPR